jgi:hypothetical protein
MAVDEHAPERETESSTRPVGPIAILRRNRAFTALFVICIVGGSVCGVVYLSDDYSLLRRLFGGALGGGGIAFLMTATKMI